MFGKGMIVRFAAKLDERAVTYKAIAAATRSVAEQDRLITLAFVLTVIAEVVREVVDE